MSFERFAGEVDQPGYTGPSAFVHLLENLPAPDFEFNDEEKKQFNVRTLDNSVTGYYVAMGMEHTHMARPGPISSSMPLLDIKGFAWWIFLHIGAGSEPMHQLLNKLLNTPGKSILDPDTGYPFSNGNIPKSCFPPADPECEEALREAQSKWAETRKVVVDQSKLSQMDLLSLSAHIQHMRSLNTAQNIEMQRMSSLQATLAAQNAWNTRQNIAKQSWGNF
jgi:hypothetical protein